MPTETDVKLADDLAEFRLEAAQRFEKVTERFGSVDKSLGIIDRDLKFIRWIGVFFAGILVVLVERSINLAWEASAVVSKVEQQGGRLDKVDGRMDRVEKRLDGIDQKLDTLISRTAPKAKE